MKGIIVFVFMCSVAFSFNNNKSVQSFQKQIKNSALDSPRIRYLFRRGAAYDKACNESIEAIFQYINENGIFHFINENVTLVLGLTGNGKSTLSLALTSPEQVNSKKISTGKYVLTDNNNLIGAGSALESKTLSPNLMIEKNGTKRYSIYDCPGFDDTRGAKHDMFAMYSIHKLFKSVTGVNFVLTARYTAVESYLADRIPFMDMAEHVINLLQDVRKYRDSILFVATKVPNETYKKKGVLYLIEDSDIIDSIVQFVNATKYHIIQEMPPSEMNKQIVELTDILLKRNRKGEYENIHIFRLADEEGSLTEMTLLTDELTHIKSSIHKKKFISTRNNDFGIQISDKSKNCVRDLMDQMRTVLISDIAKIDNDINLFYRSIEERENESTEFREKIASAYRKLQPIKFKKHHFCDALQQIKDFARKSNINIDASLSELQKHLDLIAFIKLYSDFSSTEKIYDFTAQFSRSVTYLRDTEEWYEFLVHLKVALPQYDAKQESTKEIAFEQKRTECLNAKIIIGKTLSEIGFAEFLSRVDKRNYERVSHIQLNQIKSRALQNVIMNQLYAISKTYVDRIDDEILEFYQQIVENELDLEKLAEKVSLAHRNLHPIEFEMNNFSNSLKNITIVAQNLGINISASLSKLNKRRNIIQMFETFSRCSSNNIPTRLNRSVTYLNDSNRWYKFAFGVKSAPLNKFKQITGKMTCIELKKNLCKLIECVDNGSVNPLVTGPIPIKFGAMGNILKDKLYEILHSDVTQIDEEIIKFYQRVADQEQDLVKLQDIIKSANDYLQPIGEFRDFDYSLFTKECAKGINSLGINVSVPLSNLKYHLKWIDCFNTVDRSYKYNISAPLNKSVNYLRDTKASSLEKLLKEWNNVNVADSLPIDHSPPQNIMYVYDFVAEAEKVFILDNRTDVVIVLGLTGTGKSTITSFLTGSVLVSVEYKKNSGIYLIRDSQHLITGSNSSTVSKTLIPNIFMDNEKNVIFYDCPGFEDSRGITNDILATFLIKKLLKHATSAKFIFAVQSESVMMGHEKLQFKILLKHAISLIRNIDKYENGIGLIVTKVTDRVNDDKTIENIGRFMESVKTELNNETPENERSMKKLIDILLKKNGQKYDRIKIHRTLTNSGLLNHMHEQQKEKEAMKDMIYNTLEYVTTDNSDFGLSISDKTEASIRPMVELFQGDLMKDVSDIGDVIMSFYLKEEKEIKNIAAFIEKMKVAEEKLSKIQETDPILYRNKLLNAISSLNIAVSNEILERFKKHIETVNFLKQIRIELSKSFDISNGLRKTTQYISESKNWYSFLFKLHDDLSAAEKLSNPGIYDPNAFINSINRIIFSTSDEKENVDFTVVGNIFKKSGYGIDNMKVNKLKLMALRDIVKQTMLYDIQWICDSNKLSVKGYNVKISDVLNKTCQTKVIEVFALNKIFINDNINKIGEQTTIFIIAPVWEVYGTSTITLSGRDGENHNIAAKNGEGRNDGYMGEPGKPGGSSGHFIGIGDTFRNIENLRIFTHGGKGGSGQTGGKGGDGRNGETAKFTNSEITDEKYWTEKGFYFESGYWEKTTTFIWSTTNTYPRRKVFGKSDERSGRGGDGGCGGLGGNGGQKFFIGLTQTPEITFSSHKGDNGSVGLGGSPGKTTKNGDTLVIRYYSSCSNGVCREENIKSWVHERISGQVHTADKGKDGGNCHSRKKPSEVVFPLSRHTIIDYGSFFRQNLVNVNCLSNFAKNLNNNENIRKMYNIMDFIYELQSLESQYNDLKNEIDLYSYYESFLHRLNEYEKTLDKSNEMRKILCYLYAAAIVKISSNIDNQSVILNLHDYLNQIEKIINDLRVNERDVQIANQRKRHVSTLNTQMESAKNLINNKILPEIDKTLKKIDSTIDKLINDTIEMQNKTQTKISAAEENKKKLGASMFLQVIFSSLRTASSALGLLGPAGAVGGSTMGAGTMLLETITTDTGSSLTGLTTKLTWSIDKIGTELKYKNELFKQQLNDISRELDSNPNSKNDFRDIRREIGELQRQIQDAERRNKPISDHWSKKLNAKVEEEREQLERANIKNVDRHLNAKLRILDNVRVYSNILVNSLETYNKIRANKDKMKLVDEVINDLRVELEGWKMHEEEIYDVLIPIFGKIRNYLESQSLNQDSRIELDIHKWEIKDRLRDIKLTFNQMIKIPKNQAEFSHYFDKIGAAMDILIDIYGRIDSLSGDSKFSTYISQITSNGLVSTNNIEISDAIKSLDAMIQTNLVLEQHKLIIHAFKQHYFPFAPLYIDKFELPQKYQFNDTTSLKETAIKQIEGVKNGIVISKTTLQKKDIDVFSDIMFHSNESICDLPPFYTWKNQENNKEIRNLLQGEEIVIFADIKKGLVKNAIKFNEIGIHLRTSNETIQSQLDEAIVHFTVTMKMFGKNYYRCQERIYNMFTDGSIVIKHSMKYDSNGNPKRPNDLYDKMSKSNYFLSPYVLWSIQLTNENNEKTLTKFLDENIDIELIGRGQYMDNTKSMIDNVCTDHLDKYYTLESIF